MTKNLREHPKFLGLTQLLVEARVFMSWRAAIGGEAIPPDDGGDRFSGDVKQENCVTPSFINPSGLWPIQGAKGVILAAPPLSNAQFSLSRVRVYP